MYTEHHTMTITQSEENGIAFSFVGFFFPNLILPRSINYNILNIIVKEPYAPVISVNYSFP